MEFAAVAYQVDPHSSSLQKEYVVFYATLEWLAFKFHLNIFHMLHRAPLRYVDVPAESTVDLRGLTQALVNKEKKRKICNFFNCIRANKEHLEIHCRFETVASKDTQSERET